MVVNSEDKNIQASAEAVKRKLTEALAVCKAEVAPYKAIAIDLKNSDGNMNFKPEI